MPRLVIVISSRKIKTLEILINYLMIHFINLFDSTINDVGSLELCSTK